MRLELNSKVISERADEATLTSALQKMEKDDVLAIRRGHADFVQVEGTESQGFSLNIYEDAEGTSFSTGARKLNLQTAVDVLVRFGAGHTDWRDIVRGSSLRSGAKELEKAQGTWQGPGVIGLIALAVFGIPFLAWGIILQIVGNTTPLSWGDIAKGIATIVVLSGYMAWLDVFFRVVRPKLAMQLSKSMGTPVEESRDVYDMGLWTTRNGGPVNRVMVFLLDIGITVAGCVIPIALPAVILLALYG